MMKGENTLEGDLTKQDRINEFGEVFTPPELVNEVLNEVLEEEWKTPSAPWLDDCCGEGVWLMGVGKKLIEYGHSKTDVLSQMLYGVDIQKANVIKCIENLHKAFGDGDDLNIEEVSVEEAQKQGYKGRKGIICLFSLNKKLLWHFACADSLEYQFKFGSEEDTNKNNIGKWSVQTVLSF